MRCLRSVLTIVALLFFTSSCKDSRSGDPPPPTGAPAAMSLKSLLDDPKVAIIDVRTPAEFKGGHIPKALNVPLSQISQVGAHIKDKSRPVVLYCRSGSRSGRALKMLREMGYKKMINGGGVKSLARTMGVELK